MMKAHLLCILRTPVLIMQIIAAVDTLTINMKIKS